MKKVLIANRGEIAVRIIRACHDLGLQTVAVYSQADAEALHVLHAQEAICIGPAPAPESYLKKESLIAACEITNADAVHPGYGFLSESAQFASICESCGLTFIGPKSQAIALLGDKVQAKQLAGEVGCPVIPGSAGAVTEVETAQAEAEQIGFPLMIKASAGGGGKGIRIAHHADEFVTLFAAAKQEAIACFGNADLYLEKMIVKPRHIEVQVIGDNAGHYIHLGERDCTIQRRRQKLIEEAPSPILSPALREQMGQAAIAIVRAAHYHTVATVEFLLDENNRFYFMEVNTRIQVEHTITEELTGIDLLREQICTARGERLRHCQHEIAFNGHVLELRINAEDPSAGRFTPSPGLVDYYTPPGGPHVRVDSACYSGYRIPPFYDSLIAKLIVKGESREEAIAVAQRALSEFHIGGVDSTIGFHQFMLSHPQFLSGDYQIDFVDQLIDRGELASLSK